MSYGRKKTQHEYFKVWGCLAYCKKNDPKKTKLGPRRIKYAFVGYVSNSKGYRLLNLESHLIIEYRYMDFFEHSLTFENKSQTHNNGESEMESPIGGRS